MRALLPRKFHSAQTASTRPRSRGTDIARGLPIVVPQNMREQGMPDARCTRGLVCEVVRKKLHTSIQGSGEHPTFPAQGSQWERKV